MEERNYVNVSIFDDITDEIQAYEVIGQMEDMMLVDYQLNDGSYYQTVVETGDLMKDVEEFLNEPNSGFSKHGPGNPKSVTEAVLKRTQTYFRFKEQSRFIKLTQQLVSGIRS